MVLPSPDDDRTRADLLSELADLPYFEVDGERNVVAMSPAMERVTGFSRADILGRSCLRLHRCGECLRGCGVFDLGEVRDKHLELYRADGSLVQVSKSGRVFRDPDGRIVGAIEVVRPLAQPAADPTTNGAGPALDEARSIRVALENARYNRAEAARTLGVSRTTLWRKMKAYGL